MPVCGSSSDSSFDSEGRDDDTITKVIAVIHVHVFIHVITQISEPWSQQIARFSDNRSCLDNENIIN